MELLIILMAPLYLVVMAAIHQHALPEVKVYSRMAFGFMILAAGLTSVVHFAILTVGRQMESAGYPSVPWLFSWKWPSLAYALDILAWDWFFALAVLFAVPVIKGGRLEKTARILLLAAGGLSLAGLIGVPLADMQVRNIGIIGYGAVAPAAFLLLGLILGRARKGRPDRT